MEQEAVTLWRPTGQAELDLVAALGWRAWPPRLQEQPIFYPVLNRWYATKITREWNVAAGGVGYVTRFQVRRGYLDRFTVQQAGGRDVLEYWIPAEDLEEFNGNIVGVIVEEACYRGAVEDQEFDDAGMSLGCAFPAPWRDYLQSRSWLRRGWLPSGCYLALMTPAESAAAVQDWAGSLARFPGLAPLGGDGAREVLAVDARDDNGQVGLIDITSSGWSDALPQATTVTEFIERVEAGTFEFSW